MPAQEVAGRASTCWNQVSMPPSAAQRYVACTLTAGDWIRRGPDQDANPGRRVGPWASSQPSDCCGHSGSARPPADPSKHPGKEAVQAHRAFHTQPGADEVRSSIAHLLDHPMVQVDVMPIGPSVGSPQAKPSRQPAGSPTTPGGSPRVEVRTASARGARSGQAPTPRDPIAHDPEGPAPPG